MTRILIVEDDLTTAAMLAGTVRRQQWQAHTCGDLASAWQHLCSQPVDVVLLDLQLPDGLGTDLLRKLRRSTEPGLPDAKTPVLVVSSRSQLAIRLSALDLGADGYVIKPVHLEEVAAVVRALLRRRTTLAAGQIVHRQLVVDPNNRFVQRNGSPVELTEQEFAVLLALLEERPRPLSRADIQERSGNRVGEGGAVEVHVHHLRKKLGEDVIRTVRGVGYCIPV